MKEDILIVDDEAEICDLVELYLLNEGYNVHKFYNGADALRCIEESNVDLAILDVMLPDIDGFEILRIVREKYFFPIIMLTAKVDDVSQLSGFTFGADDYIKKPFNPLELVLRVKTHIRRYKKYNVSNVDINEFNIFGLSISKNSRICTLDDRILNLTPTEFDILYYLCEHRGQVVSNEELFRAVWKERYFDANNNTIMSHIARLREKMNEEARKPKYIKTVWGVGYKID